MVLFLLRRSTIVLLSALAALTVAGCAGSPASRLDYFAAASSSDGGRPASIDGISFWDGDGVRGAPRIEIRLSAQRAEFYRGDLLVGVSALSTGREGFDTPTGSFKVIQKDKVHASTLYGQHVDVRTGEVLNADVNTRTDKTPPGAKYVGAPMPNFIRVVGGVGLHAGNLPGVPASHGCIRMPLQLSEHFFNNVELGTPVVIKP